MNYSEHHFLQVEDIIVHSAKDFDKKTAEAIAKRVKAKKENEFVDWGIEPYYGRDFFWHLITKADEMGETVCICYGGDELGAS